MRPRLLLLALLATLTVYDAGAKVRKRGGGVIDPNNPRDVRDGAEMEWREPDPNDPNKHRPKRKLKVDVDANTYKSDDEYGTAKDKNKAFVDDCKAAIDKLNDAHSPWSFEMTTDPNDAASADITIGEADQGALAPGEGGLGNAPPHFPGEA